MTPDVLEYVARWFWQKLESLGPQPFCLDYLRDKLNEKHIALDVKSREFVDALRYAAAVWVATPHPDIQTNATPFPDRFTRASLADAIRKGFLGYADTHRVMQFIEDDVDSNGWRDYAIRARRAIDILTYVEGLP